MLIDTHTHVQFNAFKGETDEVIKRTLAAGVWLINTGTQIDTSREALKLAEEHGEGVFAAVGLHPEHTYRHTVTEENDTFRTREEIFDYQAYKDLALSPKVVGIGECGLDYFWFPLSSPPQEMGRGGGEVEEYTENIKKNQREAFLRQIDLALELDKVLCVHCRPSKGTTDAYEEIIQIISKIKNQKSKIRFEVHCFTGTLEVAQKFIDLGGYLGFNGIVTFDKTGLQEKLVKNLGLERVILETDAPYLTPVPHRGKRNEPAYVEYTARQIAAWLGVSFEEVAKLTTQNAKKLFRI